MHSYYRELARGGKYLTYKLVRTSLQSWNVIKLLLAYMYKMSSFYFLLYFLLLFVTLI